MIILVALIVILSSYLVINKYKNRHALGLLQKIPGPTPFPIIGTAWTLANIPTDKLFEYVVKEYKKYYPGPYRTWLGPVPAVNVFKPEHIEAVVNNQIHITKGVTYNFLRPWLGDGLLTSTGEKWFEHRRLLTPAFHFKILDQFSEVFFENIEILLRRLETKANGDYFDVYPFITRCALDIICETAMGVSINAQTDEESEYVKALYTVSDLTMKRSVLPWLQPDIIWNNISDGKKYNKCVSVLHGFTNGVIKDRRQTRKYSDKNTTSTDDENFGGKKRLAFLDILLESAENGANLSDVDIREEVDTFMFEGHDTTTAAMCWALFLLGNNPDVQDKVFKEIQDILQGSNRPIVKPDLVEMKYLEMVIKETLRLYPSVPIIGRILKEDLKIGDYMVPKGTVAFLNIFNSQRDPAHFENPNTFDPDNFLIERTAKRHPFAFMPFSAGPRNCIGQKFALLEEKAILSSILRKYKICSEEKMEDIHLVGSLVLRPENGVKIRLEPRN